MAVQPQSGKTVSFSGQNVFCEVWSDMKYLLLLMRSGKSQEARSHRPLCAKIAKKAFLGGEVLSG